jgi:hypothetical protein
MSSRKNDYKKNEYTDEDFNGINSLLRAAETLDKDRIKDLIDVDKTLSEIDREVIKQYINSQPSLTNKQMIQLINNMRMSKMPFFNKYPKVDSVESFKDDTKALSQTRAEREQAKMDARNGPPLTLSREVYENTLNNGRKQNYGGKRRNKTRGKSRRRTRKYRKYRKSRKS